ncbi:MAG: succinate--CoA ligase subunit beta, partial [SAR324 cluster bacterium]|nr:succinate--CoA ligase subunit beta [SAR324 cluster bacterium]
EEVARNKPEKIHKIIVEQGMEMEQGICMDLTRRLELQEQLSREFDELLSKLHKMFFQYDLLLIEINPLVLTKENEMIVLDAKCVVDDNALFRQPELRALVDEDEIDPKELAASRFGLSYIALDGHIGCMVNGAGLAMATMDLVKLFGGSPANFLDVGGGASTEAIAAGFRILLSDPNVRVVLVNIFGGILHCDLIARGIVDAATQMEIKVPLIVRLQGTNFEAGRKILKDSGLKIVTANTMAEAASKAVEAEATVGV